MAGECDGCGSFRRSVRSYRGGRYCSLCRERLDSAGSTWQVLSLVVEVVVMVLLALALCVGLGVVGLILLSLGR